VIAAASVARIDVDDAAVVRDIDTPRDLAEAR
jgi:CTP:molybdopterin cytidylyltransferase MocA